MALLSNIRVLITANTKGFSKGLQKSQKETRDFNKSISGLGRNIAGVFSAGAVIAFGQELASLNAKIYNARIAFERFGGQTLFMEELRESTGGMVDDLHLMQQAIQATNLGLRQSDLPTFFKFATIRAAETGVAVDFLVNSIVSGIGRESRLVLDNLGISLKDINLRIEELGSTFTPAAISLIAENFTKARREIDDTTNSVFKLNAQWKNFVQNIAEGVVGQGAAGILGRLASGLETINKFYQVDLGEQTLAEDLTKITANTEDWHKWLGFIREQWMRIGREADETMKDEKWDITKAFKLTSAEFFSNQSNAVIKFIKHLMTAEGAWEEFLKKYTKKVEPPEVLDPEEGFEPLFGYLEGLKEQLRLATLEQLKLSETAPDFDEQAQGYRDLIAGLREMIDLYLKGAEAAELMKEETEDLKEEMYNISEVFAEVASIAIRGFVDALMMAIETGDVIGAFSSFLSQLGEMMAAYGAALVAFGVAEEVLKYGDAYSKIAAGAVLIAAGAALATIGGNIKSHAGGGGSFGGGRGSYSSYGGTAAFEGGFDFNREIVMVARGEDLVAVINRNNFRQGVNI